MVNGCGAGKTLLVADWVAGHPELPVAWLTTDTDGQGPGMFWAYLLQALRTSGVPLPGDIASPADANRVGDALPARLAALLSARDRPVVLILDEFDRVTAPRSPPSSTSCCATPHPGCGWSSSPAPSRCCPCTATGPRAS